MDHLYLVVTTTVTSFFDIFISFIFFRKFMQLRWSSVIFNTAVPLAIASAAALVNNCCSGSALITVTAMLIAIYLLCLLIFEGSLMSHLLLPLLYFGLALVTQTTVGVILARVFNTDIQHLNSYPLASLGQIISQIVLFFIIMVVVNTKKSRGCEIPIRYGLALMLIPLFSIIILYQFWEMALKDPSIINLMLMLTFVGIILINVTTFLIIDSILVQSETQMKYRLAKQQLDIQLSHYEKLAENHRDIGSFLHDIRNHLLCIRCFAEEGNNSLIVDYINALNLNGLMGLKTIDTGHPVIDALLDEKKRLAQDSGIDMTVEIMLPREIAIENIDLCVIFGNALDNAIEACNRMTSGEKKISISLKYNGNYLIFRITNTVEPEYRFSSDNYFTSKRDKELHGYGLRNIERIVKKYEGNMQITCKNGLFTLNIIIQPGVDRPVKPIPMKLRQRPGEAGGADKTPPMPQAASAQRMPRLKAKP